MSNSAAQTCCFMNDLCLKVSRSFEMIVDLVSPSGTETSSCELKGIPIASSVVSFSDGARELLKSTMMSVASGREHLIAQCSGHGLARVIFRGRRDVILLFMCKPSLFALVEPLCFQLAVLQHATGFLHQLSHSRICARHLAVCISPKLKSIPCLSDGGKLPVLLPKPGPLVVPLP